MSDSDKMNVDEAMEIARRYSNHERVTWDEFIPAFEQLASEVERLRAELAAAKAASVVPVEVVSCDPDYEMTATVVLWSNADAQRFADWLRERMKERGEG